MRPCFRSLSGIRNLAHIIGVVVSETTSEIAMATLSVTANSRKRRPTMPPIKRIGMNTAMSEVLIEKTVKPISRAPRSAASSGRIPASRGPDPRLEVGRDVLDDDDGVVDDEAGRDGQSHQ